jgi:hypothetical protein
MNAKEPHVANKKTPKIMVEVFIAPYRHRESVTAAFVAIAESMLAV